MTNRAAAAPERLRRRYAALSSAARQMTAAEQSEFPVSIDPAMHAQVKAGVGQLAASTSPTPSPAGGIHVTREDLLTWFIGAPLTILIVLIVAGVFRTIVLRLIDRVTKRAVDRSEDTRLLDARRARHTQDMSNVLMTQRRKQRAEAIASLLKSLATIAIALIAFLVMLGQFDINIGPLVASAGILGAAIGFGAQNLIKDYVSGVAMILEDQFGVGDLVDLGPAVGHVENVTLRVTQLRDSAGIVWYVRNGEVVRVANRSKGWAVALVDVQVPYEADLSHVRDVIERVAQQIYDDPHFETVILERPEYAGVESITTDTVSVRVTTKVAPERQVAVTRALRERIKRALDDAGIVHADTKKPPGTTTAPGGPEGPDAEPQTGAS